MIENAIAGAAAAISLIALAVSLWSTMIQRVHNRKSVRPVGHVQLSDSVQGLQIQIVNKGCGPMHIKEFAADRKTTVHYNLVNHLPNQILGGFTHQFHTEPQGYWLMPGDNLVLLRLEGDDGDPEFVKVRESVRSILCETTVSVVYSDIYDHVHPTANKSLSWFSRQL